MTDRVLGRREVELIAPTCDRSEIWRGEPAPCPLFAAGANRTTLQGSGQWRGSVLILADGGTASAAEDFVTWLKENKVATVLGERTAGAGCGYVNGGAPTRLKVVPVEIWMPNCARFLDNGRNEIEGVDPDIRLPMGNDGARSTALANTLKNMREHDHP